MVGESEPVGVGPGVAGLSEALAQAGCITCMGAYHHYWPDNAEMRASQLERTARVYWCRAISRMCLLFPSSIPETENFAPSASVPNASFGFRAFTTDTVRRGVARHRVIVDRGLLFSHDFPRNDWLTVLREGLLSPLEEISKAVLLSHIPYYTYGVAAETGSHGPAWFRMALLMIALVLL
jgi:hypothetical protein